MPPSTRTLASTLASRFPLLEHLAWANAESGQLRHRLGTSQVEVPPPSLLDPSGPLELVLTRELRRALAERLAARYRVEESGITLTAGVSEALAIACAGLIDPGDTVLVEIPTYRSLPGVAGAFGARVERLERGLDGAVEAERASARVRECAAVARRDGRRLAAVLLTDLHNPSGAPLADPTMDAIAESCRREGAVLVVDEVYRDADAMRPVGTVRNRHPDAVSLGSLSKAYGLGGLRCGWILAPPEWAEVFARVKCYFSVIPAAPSVGLAIRALGNADRILEWARGVVAANRTVFERVLREEPGGYRYPPRASRGTVAFPYRPGGPDTAAEAAVWARDFEVEVAPGHFFEAASGVRLGLGSDPKEFGAAIACWAEAAGGASKR
jgi:hypothetical protein